MHEDNYGALKKLKAPKLPPYTKVITLNFISPLLGTCHIWCISLKMTSLNLFFTLSLQNHCRMVMTVK
jgi:hypothetical protein